MIAVLDKITTELRRIAASLESKPVVRVAQQGVGPPGNWYDGETD